MSGFIILQDGRAWTRANWAYDAALEAIVTVLMSRHETHEFAYWLTLQGNHEQGTGLGQVDLRELTPTNQAAFIQACRVAYHTAVRDGPVGWHDPSFFAPCLENFALLLRMLEAVQRGDAPELLNPHMRELIPASGKRVGPGW